MQNSPPAVFSLSAPFNFLSLYHARAPYIYIFAAALHTYTSIRPTCLRGFSDGNDKHIGLTKASRVEAVVDEEEEEEEATRMKEKERERKRR